MDLGPIRFRFASDSNRVRIRSDSGSIRLPNSYSNPPFILGQIVCSFRFGQINLFWGKYIGPVANIVVRGTNIFAKERENVCSATLTKTGYRWTKKLCTLLDLCVSSLRRGHANLLCIVPILTDDPRGRFWKKCKMFKKQH